MSKHPVSAFLARKDIEVTFQRYAIDALSAMAQGLFASLLIGTILTTVGDLSGLGFFNEVGGFAKSVAGPAMAVASGMGTCGLVGPIGVYTGWVAGMEAGAAAPGALEWAGLVLVCLVLPAVISWAVAALMRRAGLIADGDLKLED